MNLWNFNWVLNHWVIKYYRILATYNINIIIIDVKCKLFLVICLSKRWLFSVQFQPSGIIVQLDRVKATPRGNNQKVWNNWKQSPSKKGKSSV